MNAESYPNRWRILAAVLAVLIMAPVDGSVVNIIIPLLLKDFGVPPEHVGTVAWVPLAYLIVIAGFMLPMGRLGDLWGFRRLYLLGAALFTVSSALCGLAPSLGWLIAARVVQGVGACMMMALSTGIITAIFPAEERGRALGMLGMGIAIGLVLGPSLGGFLAHWGGWRLVFFINLPIGLFGGLWCARVMPPLAPVQRARVDWLGGVLIVSALTPVLLAVTHGDSWGWGSPAVLGLLAVGIASALAFALHERRSAAPMLDYSLFRNRVFVGANIASMMNFLGQSCAIFLTPMLLVIGLGYDTGKAGLILAVVPLVVMVFAPISGALSDRIGTRGLAVAGESFVALGLAGMAALLHTLSAGRLAPERALPWILPLLALVGLGTGLFQPPNNSAIMGSVPRAQLGIGGSILATMRNLGFAFGTAVSSAVAAVGMGPPAPAGAPVDRLSLFRGISGAFALGAFFVFLGVLTSLWRQDSIRTRTRAF